LSRPPPESEVTSTSAASTRAASALNCSWAISRSARRRRTKIRLLARTPRLQRSTIRPPGRGVAPLCANAGRQCRWPWPESKVRLPRAGRANSAQERAFRTPTGRFADCRGFVMESSFLGALSTRSIPNAESA
jgi:hypothetical protein